MPPKSQQPPLVFKTSGKLSNWLEKHHATAIELWVSIYKSDSGVASVTWTDCMIEALRVGWIDGLKKSLDDASYLQRLTPRKANSNWSVR